MSIPWNALGLDDFLGVTLRQRCAVLKLDYVALEEFTSLGFAGHRLAAALTQGIHGCDGADLGPRTQFLLRKACQLVPTDREQAPEVRLGVHAWPYVLDVPEWSIALKPGRTLTVGATLFGEAADTWPAWVEGGRMLTLGERSLVLVGARVLSRRGEYVAASSDGPGEPLTLADIRVPAPPASASEWLIRLQTPTRISKRTDLFPDGSLTGFLKSIIRRLRAVAAADLAPDAETELLAAAGRVAVDAAGTTFRKVRHNERDFSGRAGTARCRGPLADLLPLLVLGRITHVGSQYGWGMGRYVIDDA